MKETEKLRNLQIGEIKEKIITESNVRLQTKSWNIKKKIKGKLMKFK